MKQFRGLAINLFLYVRIGSGQTLHPPTLLNISSFKYKIFSIVPDGAVPPRSLGAGVRRAEDAAVDGGQAEGGDCVDLEGEVELVKAT